MDSSLKEIELLVEKSGETGDLAGLDTFLVRFSNQAIHHLPAS